MHGHRLRSCCLLEACGGNKSLGLEVDIKAPHILSHGLFEVGPQIRRGYPARYTVYRMYIR